MATEERPRVVRLVNESNDPAGKITSGLLSRSLKEIIMETNQAM
jgi:hypothetical protein